MTPKAARRAPIALLLVAVCAAALVDMPAHAQAKGISVRILAGPSVPHMLEIPYPEGWFELSAGDALEVPAPAVELPGGVDVWSSAWLPLLEREPAPHFDGLAARYYPTESLIHVDSWGTDRWFRLAGVAQEILSRFVPLARSGALGERPTRATAQIAMWRLLGEPLRAEVSLGGRVLTGVEAETFWNLFAASEERELRPSEVEPGADYFGPWTGGAWPGQLRAHDVGIVFHYLDGTSERWDYLWTVHFLTPMRTGWPSWPGIEASPALVRFIEERAGSPPSGEEAPSGTAWLAALALGAALSGAAALGRAIVRSSGAPRIV